MIHESPHANSVPDRTQPSNPQDRIISIDVIRGIAIAGILLINLGYFLSQAGQTEDPVGTDAVIWQVVDDIALGKFHFVFAILFGAHAPLEPHTVVPVPEVGRQPPLAQQLYGTCTTDRQTDRQRASEGSVSEQP